VPRDGLRFSLETAQRDRIVNPSQDICQISNITLRDEDVVSVGLK
jgi:DNA polymerase III delta prime subunit